MIKDLEMTIIILRTDQYGKAYSSQVCGLSFLHALFP